MSFSPASFLSFLPAPPPPSKGCGKPNNVLGIFNTLLDVIKDFDLRRLSWIIEWTQTPSQGPNWKDKWKVEDNLKVLCWCLKMEEELSYQHRYVTTFGLGGGGKEQALPYSFSKGTHFGPVKPILTWVLQEYNKLYLFRAWRFWWSVRITTVKQHTSLDYRHYTKWIQTQ